MKVMSFRTTEEQIDLLHQLTHCTSNSASQIIRLAIDKELQDILDASREGIHKISPEKESAIENYLGFLDPNEV